MSDLKTIEVEHVPAFSVDDLGGAVLACEGADGSKQVIRFGPGAVSSLLAGIHACRVTESGPLDLQSEHFRPWRGFGFDAFKPQPNGDKGLVFYFNRKLAMPIVITDPAIAPLRRLLDRLEAWGKK